MMETVVWNCCIALFWKILVAVKVLPRAEEPFPSSAPKPDLMSLLQLLGHG